MVQLGVVIRRTGNNQRRARLVNQNRVDLIDNRVVQRSLNAFGVVVYQIVTQIVKTKFVVRTVGDVSLIRSDFVLALHARQAHADAQTQKVV